MADTVIPYYVRDFLTLQWPGDPLIAQAYGTNTFIRGFDSPAIAAQAAQGSPYRLADFVPASLFNTQQQQRAPRRIPEGVFDPNAQPGDIIVDPNTGEQTGVVISEQEANAAKAAQSGGSSWFPSLPSLPDSFKLDLGIDWNDLLMRGGLALLGVVIVALAIWGFVS